MKTVKTAADVLKQIEKAEQAAQHVKLPDNQMKQALINCIELKREYDEAPDLSYLDQYANSIDPKEQEYYKKDHERKNDYGDGWSMIGITAVATIYLPFEVEPGKVNYKIETITSGGLWGIEDDSGEDYLKEIEAAEIDDLKTWLNMLNVSFTGFDWKTLKHTGVKYDFI